VVVYDLIYRVLRHKYGKDNVLYVRNITDVDDKINNSAKERKIAISELTKEITEIFHKDIAALNCLPPVIEPRATNHIAEMIDIIKRLLDLGHAYVAEDGKHVFFAVVSDKNYGLLAGRKTEDMIAGARVSVQDIKHSPEDFVLWKPSLEDDPEGSVFDSPWGAGRPGWHIECSAMSAKYLGNDFDIHGGGVDLLFPHHTNEVAQSCCAHPGSGFASYWVHNGFLTVNGEKMSKSLNNFITLRDVFAKDIQGEVVRYIFLRSHYRGQIDFNLNDLVSAKKTLDGFYRLMLEHPTSDNAGEIDSDLWQVLQDDFNTPAAFAVLHDLARKANIENDLEKKKTIIAQIKSSMQLMGFLYEDPIVWFQGENDREMIAEIESLIEQRSEAKKQKNFALADKIRNDLLAKNIILEDNKDGTIDWKRK
jgi:cysteinyl-tRNA synthetase